MRPPPSTQRQTPRSRARPAFGLAALALVACAKTPDPPGECSLIQVNVDWANFHPIPLQIDLDSLRSLVAKTEDEGTRAHLVQEYVFAANRLDPGTREAALASVTEVLKRVRRQ